MMSIRLPYRCPPRMSIEKNPGEIEEVGEQERDDREQRPDQAMPRHAAVPPAIVFSNVSTLTPVVGELGDDPPVAKDRDLVAQPKYLFDLGRDEEHRHSVVAQRHHETLNLGLRSDVDTPSSARRG